MVDVFCLGPVEFDGQLPAFVAIAFADGRMHEPVITRSVADCFSSVRKLHPQATIYCEPEHAAAGKRFGFVSRELSEELLAARAGIALSLANGDAVSPSTSPPVMFELLVASTEFLAKEAWQRFDSDALLHVELDGDIRATWEASIMGTGRFEYGVALYSELGTHARLHAVRNDADARKLMMRISTLAVTLDDEPAFAARAIGDVARIPFVPIVMRLEKGKPRAIEPEHALALAACLRAAASDDRVGTARADGLAVRVALRDPATVAAPAKTTARRPRRR